MASEIAAIDAASSNSSEQGDSKAASAPAPNPLYRQRRWLPAARRSSRSSTVSYLPTPKRPGETSSFPILSFSLMMFFSCFRRGHLRHHQRWPQHCGKQASPQWPNYLLSHASVPCGACKWLILHLAAGHAQGIRPGHQHYPRRVPREGLFYKG